MEKQKTINAQLSQKINTLENNVDKRIDGLQNDLDQKIDILQYSISRLTNQQHVHQEEECLIDTIFSHFLNHFLDLDLEHLNLSNSTSSTSSSSTTRQGLRNWFEWTQSP